MIPKAIPQSPGHTPAATHRPQLVAAPQFQPVSQDQGPQATAHAQFSGPGLDLGVKQALFNQIDGLRWAQSQGRSLPTIRDNIGKGLAELLQRLPEHQHVHTQQLSTTESRAAGDLRRLQDGTYNWVTLDPNLNPVFVSLVKHGDKLTGYVRREATLTDAVTTDKTQALQFEVDAQGKFSGGVNHFDYFASATGHLELSGCELKLKGEFQWGSRPAPCSTTSNAQATMMRSVAPLQGTTSTDPDKQGLGYERREMPTFLEPMPQAFSGPASKRTPIVAVLRTFEGQRSLTLRAHPGPNQGVGDRLGFVDSVSVGVGPDGQLTRLAAGPSLTGSIKDGKLTFLLSSPTGGPSRYGYQTVDVSELFAPADSTCSAGTPTA